MRKYWLAILVFGVVLALWRWWWSHVDRVLPADPLTHNEIGDWFGALNTLFSGLALGGVIVTLIMQREEFKRNSEKISDHERRLREQAAMLRHTAVLQSIPTLLRQSDLELSNLLGDAQAAAISGWDINQLDREIEGHRARIAGDAALLGLLQLRQDRTPQMDAELDRLVGLVKPEERIIGELRWRRRLLYDMHEHYGQVAYIDPEDPYADQ